MGKTDISISKDFPKSQSKPYRFPIFVNRPILRSNSWCLLKEAWIFTLVELQPIDLCWICHTWSYLVEKSFVHCKPKPCRAYRELPVSQFSQGKTCFHYREPCFHCRDPVFITGISLQTPVLPCTGLQGIERDFIYLWHQSSLNRECWESFSNYVDILHAPLPPP